MGDDASSVTRRASLDVGGYRPTARQLEVLRAVHESGGVNSAARALGASPASVTMALKRLSASAGFPVVASGPKGSALTGGGLAILNELEAIRRSEGSARATVIAGTVITEDLLTAALSQSDPDALCELVIADDDRNARCLLSGEIDMALLDDPLIAYELDGFESSEITMDRLVHVDRGPRYARFKYGAQRVGFRHLEAMGADVAVERVFRSLNSLMGSGLSFFVNESLLMRRNIQLRSATDPSLLSHSIVAVWKEGNGDVGRALQALARQVRSGKY